MAMSPLYLTDHESIDSLRPAVMKSLETNLCVLVKTNLTKNNTDKINNDLLLWSELLGKDLGTSLEHHILYGTGDKSVLPAHVEGIYNPNGIYSYFTLACIRSPTQGG